MNHVNNNNPTLKSSRKESGLRLVSYQKAPGTGKESAVDADITIPESDGIVMGGKKSRYGVPVNARLAVYYIRKLWTEIERKRLLMIHQDTNDFFDDFIKVLDGDVTKFNKDDFMVQLKEFNGRWKEANTWLLSCFVIHWNYNGKKCPLKTSQSWKCGDSLLPGDENIRRAYVSTRRYPIKMVSRKINVGHRWRGQGRNRLHYVFDPGNIQ